MFAGNAAGQYLPPMVVYKSESICREWVRGGGGGGGGGGFATNAFYEYTKNGWFDSRTFEICFFKAVFVFH